jgi:hypothetical protein
MLFFCKTTNIRSLPVIIIKTRINPINLFMFLFISTQTCALATKTNQHYSQSLTQTFFSRTHAIRDLNAKSRSQWTQ